ncbi:methylthioribose-1-phosphate isomerase [Humidesulfovibrio mexicanus]|uniref:Methylthioribose-1-phosphate isomerase n=1 Tax=Humidesulfovibrio mexicanus TaxID=147047 RepID=A0A238XYS8_9BACT|nr:S-methyl-5-thioribose-1-phosphate isomerase [Humidesulfovibrio mexicanus]SNR64206.1 methylthioribose-1-phosphate isomerase [Humidesulfovibrio mexicanus]
MTEHIQFSPEKDALVLLDQRYLPTREEWFVCKTVADICEALVVMVVRGAPAIGVTAAYGCYLAAREVQASGVADWKGALSAKLEQVASARPTAVNLRWAVRLMQGEWNKRPEFSLDDLCAFWLQKAKTVHAEDIATCMAIGAAGADLIDDGDTVLTHCNAGALATAGYGTALAPIRAAVAQGKKVRVIADETRPFLQGARLTAYELHKDGIPVTVACDNACALLMQRGLVQKVIVGADRIAANGDAANKIGTFGVALIAKEFGVPFYVAAPVSTIDPETADGSLIPIEDRTPREVTHVGQTQITPDGVPVYNFAFDVTPNRLIRGIITERGVLAAPYTEAIAKLFK